MLTDDEAGQLFKSLYRYSIDGIVLETDNRALALAFSMFKTSLDRNADKYQRIVEVRREAGRRGGQKRVANIQANQANQANATLLEANEANQADSVSDSVSESVSDSVSESERDINNNILSIAKACDDRKLQRRKDKFMSSLEPFRQTYGDAMIDDFCDYWTEPNKSQSKMRYELERTWDLSRRLKRWASNNIKPNNNYSNGNNQEHNDSESARERSIRETEEYLRKRWEERGVHAEVPDSASTEEIF